jgi:hypothetical protein
MKSIEKSKQTINFPGVGAHHQKGIAEKRIGDLQRWATTLLLHAQRRWPDAISIHLWPYALRAANDSRNTYPCKQSMECLTSKFSQTGRVPKLVIIIIITKFNVLNLSIYIKQRHPNE